MQRNRGTGNPFFNFDDPFAGFGGFGGFGAQRSMLSDFFGGRDPFDGPFFQRPFSGMLEPSIFGPFGNAFTAGPPPGFLEHHVPQPTSSRGPVIEELNSDDEGEQKAKEKKDNPRKHGRSMEGPYIEDPDDVTEGRSKQIHYMNNFNRVSNTHLQPQSHSFNFQSSTVTYGGADGAYYTSSRTRRTGSDGFTFEEAKEADTSTGQASHQISRGIYNKGHAVNRKLNSDGRVDTMQMLHNLNEDELPGFDEAWNGNVWRLPPGWNGAPNVNGPGTGRQMVTGTRGGWALPSTERVHPSNVRSNNNVAAVSSGPHRSTASQGTGRIGTSFNKYQGGIK